MQADEQQLSISYNELQEKLLPLLVDTVFHVTSVANYEAISRAEAISGNRDGSFGETYPQSKVSLGRQKGYVCLFDLRNKSPEAIEWGLRCFYFLAPRPLGKQLAFLIVSPTKYRELVHWENLTDTKDRNIFHIPEVECWYPGDLPLACIQRILRVKVELPPRDQNQKLNTLEDFLLAGTPEEVAECLSNLNLDLSIEEKSREAQS